MTPFLGNATIGVTRVAMTIRGSGKSLQACSSSSGRIRLNTEFSWRRDANRQRVLSKNNSGKQPEVKSHTVLYPVNRTVPYEGGPRHVQTTILPRILTAPIVLEVVVTVVNNSGTT